MLFDAGLPIKRLLKALAAEEVEAVSLSAVLISHEHRDHCVAARDLAEQFGTPLWANVEALRAAGLHDCAHAAVLQVDHPARFGDVEVTPFPVSHDAAAPVGFRICVAGKTVTLATDLGHVTGEVSEAISSSDLVVLEANHDLTMLQGGRYPPYLRRRVSGPTGHLSNAQAAGVLAERVKGENVEVWLAHLSKENNTPPLAIRTVRAALRQVGLADLAVGVAGRDTPSLRWTGAVRPRQLRFLGIEAG